MNIERLPIIGVMGSHVESWEEYAAPVGRLIAEHDYHLLTGAGGGIMTAVAKAFVEREERAGLSIGIIPTIDYDGGYIAWDKYPNPHIELPIITQLDNRAQSDANPYSRNFVNIMTSHAVIILPGEHGTKNEVSLALRYRKPMILFGPEYEFADFPQQPARVQDISEVKEFLEKVTVKLRKDEVLSKG